jgi:hypothetical protein
VSVFVSLICLLTLMFVAPAPARAVEYTLQVAALIEDAFVHYLQGPIGSGAGELQLSTLERALGAGTVDRGGLLYDRDIYPAGEVVARAFGAVAVRPTSYASSEAQGLWKTVRWDGKPGERAVWIVRPSTMHFSEARHLGLSGGGGGLRYYIPYGVTLFPEPSVAVAYPLPILRGSEEGTPLWTRYLSRAVDLRGGLAAVVGTNTVGADWLYLLVEPTSPEPATYRVAVGWARRGSSDRIIDGAGGRIRLN